MKKSFSGDGAGSLAVNVIAALSAQNLRGIAGPRPSFNGDNRLTLMELLFIKACFIFAHAQARERAQNPAHRHARDCAAKESREYSTGHSRHGADPGEQDRDRCREHAASDSAGDDSRRRAPAVVWAAGISQHSASGRIRAANDISDAIVTEPRLLKRVNRFLCHESVIKNGYDDR